MTNANLIDRLALLPNLSDIPREEFEWLIEHGQLEKIEIGTVVAKKGKHIEKLWVILSGHIGIRVDRGVGPRRVMEWLTGDISGILPYSRMASSPGDTFAEETTEALSIHEKHFPEMINKCPVFTAHTVHIMLDRARTFNTSDLQDEKMISLGKLAAGLAHELNNPASATVRSAKMLLESLTKADVASRRLGAVGLTDKLVDQIEQIRSACLMKPVGTVLTPIQQADREDDIADWLVSHKLDPDHAVSLAETATTIDVLDTLAKITAGDTLDAALCWIAANCATHSLALDIESAATRIYELVAAVKKFTHMDNLAGSELVEVEPGIRDTIRVLAAKAKTMGAAITLDIEADLPLVRATGSELNQVWMNLIDNALDAIPQSGKIHIMARKELDRVVVCVTDDGPGIHPEVLPKIFDPFFTTKPPGQGTGMGLEITRRLLRRYQNDISVQSRPGHTEFRVSLSVEKPESNKMNQQYRSKTG